MRHKSRYLCYFAYRFASLPINTAVIRQRPAITRYAQRGSPEETNRLIMGWNVTPPMPAENIIIENADAEFSGKSSPAIRVSPAYSGAKATPTIITAITFNMGEGNTSSSTTPIAAITKHGAIRVLAERTRLPMMRPIMLENQ